MNQQSEIVQEIQNICGNVSMVLQTGWHFVYNGKHFFYIASKREGELRFCIPCVARSAGWNMEMFAKVVNDTNLNVRYIKAMILENGCISMEYDCKMTPGEHVPNIVVHVISVLDFASNYLLNRLQKL